MKHNLLAAFLVIALLSSPLVHAYDFDEAAAAYRQGNYEQAYKIFSTLAEQGDSNAQFNLGVIYQNGQGVTQNYTEAVRWYRAAAEQGDSIAQFNLGVSYEKGQGVTQNYTEAVRWYRAAAEQGDPNAQNNLALMYFKGEGVVQDYIQAHMWANIAASQGNQNAANGRDFLATEMTPTQIQEAQKLAQEWVKSR